MTKNTFEALRDALVEELLDTVAMMEEEPLFEGVELTTDERLERYAQHREDVQFWEERLDSEGWASTIHDALILERQYERREHGPTTDLAGEMAGERVPEHGGGRAEPARPSPEPRRGGLPGY